MTPASDSLPQHLEQYLGKIDVGWSTPDQAIDAIQIVRFAGAVANGLPFSTLGLSRYELRSRVSAKVIRQELLMIVPSTLRDGPIPDLLQGVARETRDSERALLRGDVIGPRGRLFKNYEMEALYVSEPVYLPDSFGEFSESGRAEAIVIAWLVPITHNEAHFVLANGWRAFESMLTELDPDLVDLSRASIV